ncbi:ABC transporter ATP-binding protein [Oxalicibacterium flavum]|uniref:ABC transporter ATP-binding protein n=1 Tax=Oxalicibacterium flavum TaxID=179467 RepID=A0A8J2UK50_9BURK|nr:ABC transporter ATP-binding protein [Oxalicibacterium flavum]GGC05151.1 ABC transporter ATP-binding protein [Oxalicibacterium flavum]
MSSEKLLLEVDGVSKKYCRNLALSLKYGFSDSIRGIFSNDSEPKKLRQNEFWSLRNISFSLKRGDRLGVLGKNGAGKSTLMKIISGITLPTEGRVSVAGKMDQMIELTSGFHPMMTGYQNARLRARIKGVSESDFQREIKRIVDFAELQDSIHTPVKYYSSGMRARLGFAVSTMNKPDILIIDEALAVGDLDFRLKCYEFISNYLEDTALIFVSHSLAHIKRFCNLGMVLESGKMKHYGDVQEAIDLYQEGGVSSGPKKMQGLNADALTFNITTNHFSEIDGIPVIGMGEGLIIKVQPHTLPSECIVSINITDDAGRALFEYRSDRDGGINALQPFHCEIGPFYLNSGVYRLNMAVHDRDGCSLLSYTPWKPFRCKSGVTGLAPFHPPGRWINT